MSATAAVASPEGAPIRISAGEVLLAAIPAGIAAGAAMAGTVMAIAEISSQPTFAAGIDSSTWTPLTGIAAFLLGPDAFHGSFHVLPIAFGLAVHLAVATLFGLAGLALVVATLGARPGLLPAAVLGLFYGLFLEVFVLNAAVNNIQGELTVYESLPQWGWWAGHAAYGVMLGLAGAFLLGSRPYAR